MAAPRRAPAMTGSLQALTAAALSLPGLAATVAHAADDSNELGFQYGHYEEGRRKLYGYNAKFDPISVDTISANGDVTLLDRLMLGMHFTQDTWSGATPVTTLPFAAMTRLTDDQLISGASAKPATGQIFPSLVDAQLNTYVNTSTNPFSPAYERDDRVIHMVTSASPETRKQGELDLGYEWDRAALNAGAGLSYEPDYMSRFLNLNGRLDFNQKLTTLEAGYSRTWAETSAVLPDSWDGWVDTTIGETDGEITRSGAFPNGIPKLTVNNKRRDWTANLGVTQVLGKSTVAKAGLGYTHAAGYLENPYKIVSFLSEGAPFARPAVDGTPLFQGTLYHTYEQRPDERNQWSANLGIVQHVPIIDVGVHFDYRYFHDDWGIDAHTFEAAWDQPFGSWMITPRIRYYTQDAAEFYYPYVQCGTELGLVCAAALRNFSSDARLSGFGALSGGVTVTKSFARGVSLEAGAEYYTHQGGLKMGGGGEDDYADFDYYVLNAALNVDLDAALNALPEAADEHGQHAGHAHHDQAGHANHAGHLAPAGLMDAHMLDIAGDVMIGYRYMYSRQAGDMLHGTSPVDDATLVASGGCDAPGCGTKPSEMNMHMHMIELMYAPTDWLTLMAMPQFVDMNMDLEPIEGGPQSIHSTHESHQTGGVGDTGLYAMFRLLDAHGQHVHATLGVSIPTGESDIRLNPVGGHNHDPNTVTEPEYLHYGMQLGSGTWDLKPSVTYTGEYARAFWGAQVGGTKRLEDQNDAGYAFGDIFQSSVWTGFRLTDWVSTTVRGVYTKQGKIKDDFDTHSSKDVATGVVTELPNSIAGPMDSPASYGGRFWDLGLGVKFSVPSGTFRGNTVGFEWLEPLSEDVNGYQLERETQLSASWSYMY